MNSYVREEITTKRKPMQYRNKRRKGKKRTKARGGENKEKIYRGLRNRTSKHPAIPNAAKMGKNKQRER